VTFREYGEESGGLPDGTHDPGLTRTAAHDNPDDHHNHGNSPDDGAKPDCGPGHPGHPGGPGGTLTVTGELLAHGFVPLQPTGVTTTATIGR
jgi:hypothetical protein